MNARPTNPDLEKAFKTNKTYYEMMRQHNTQTGDVPSIELEIIRFIERIKKGQTLLDAGSGEGTITLWIAEQKPEIKVVGVDLSPVGIEMSQNDAKAKKLENLTLQVDNLEKLSLPDSMADKVLSQSVVEHVPDLSAMLSELYRVMKPGAEGIIRVSNAASGFHFSLSHYFFRRLEVLPHKPSLSLEEGNYYQHRHNFDAHELTCYTLTGLLEKAGFRITQMTTFPDHLKDEPGPAWRRLILRSLMLFRSLPLIKLIGPTAIVEFKK